MRRWSLRTKILIASSGTLLALIGATLAYVSWQANDYVNQRIQADLQGSSDVIAAADADRFATLQLTAQVLAAVPQIRPLLETNDAATIRDVLRDFLQQTSRADLLVVLDPTGQTMARTDAITSLEIADARTKWIDPLLAGRRPHGFVTTTTGVYHAAAETAEVQGTVFGFLIAGARVDDEYAQRLRAASGDDVVILSDDRVLASTIPAQSLPWKTRGEWEQFVASGPMVVTIAGEEYAARPAPAADPTIAYVALQSRDRALVPYRSIQIGLLAIGALAVLAGVAASAVLARTITAPVARLVEGTKQVAAGNFDYAVDVKSEDELGTLARSFNTMTRGLSERADMQKFVSQSTMEMIQSRARTSTAERKRLTILFSDIRGFTHFSELRPPEEVVDWLNRCLGAQANLVRKHNGDVDKYIGDAVFAVFNGDDMAFDAVRCAVEIHRALEKLKVPGNDELDVGIGIVTGDVLLGSIGSDDRRDFTAIGNQVNLCSRLCAMAGPREILIADSTYQLVRDVINAERKETVAVRGVAQPVDVYRMVIARSGTPSEASPG